jgi:hypothetical protein
LDFIRQEAEDALQPCLRLEKQVADETVGREAKKFVHVALASRLW